MSDLMRKEFEAACEARFNWATQYQYRDESESALSAWNGESYRSRIVQGMWWAWQASRDRLVIELPEKARITDPSDMLFIGSNGAINKCRDAIHAAGVKTK